MNLAINNSTAAIKEALKKVNDFIAARPAEEGRTSVAFDFIVTVDSEYWQSQHNVYKGMVQFHDIRRAKEELSTLKVCSLGYIVCIRRTHAK